MANMLQHMDVETLLSIAMDHYDQLHNLPSYHHAVASDFMDDPEYLKLMYAMYLRNGIQVIELPSFLDLAELNFDVMDEYLRVQRNLVGVLSELKAQHILAPFIFVSPDKFKLQLREEFYRRQLEFCFDAGIDAIVFRKLPSIEELDVVLNSYQELRILRLRGVADHDETDFPARYLSCAFDFDKSGQDIHLRYKGLDFSDYLLRYEGQLDIWGIEGLGTKDCLEALAYMRICAQDLTFQLRLAVCPQMRSARALTPLACLSEFESFVLKALPQCPALIAQNSSIALADMVSAFLILKEYQERLTMSLS